MKQQSKRITPHIKAITIANMNNTDIKYQILVIQPLTSDSSKSRANSGNGET